MNSFVNWHKSFSVQLPDAPALSLAFQSPDLPCPRTCFLFPHQFPRRLVRRPVPPALSQAAVFACCMSRPSFLSSCYLPVCVWALSLSFQLNPFTAPASLSVFGSSFPVAPYLYHDIATGLVEQFNLHFRFKHVAIHPYVVEYLNEMLQVFKHRGSTVWFLLATMLHQVYFYASTASVFKPLAAGEGVRCDVGVKIWYQS